jgi:uncharacterized protein YdeI (YjbR/CyaY-like superfamily)
MDPTFFATPAAWRAWLARHHATAAELWVGFYKRGSGRPSITWPESVDQALCYGWIDGVRRSLGPESYAIRFTPRRPGSTWSKVNLQRVGELEALGLMQPAGQAAHAARTAAKSGIYAYEQRDQARLTPEQEREFKRNRKAWAYFQAEAPWYRRTATYWVISAKRAETRAKRLATLIADSVAGRRIGQLDRAARPLAPRRARP